MDKKAAQASLFLQNTSVSLVFENGQIATINPSSCSKCNSEHILPMIDYLEDSEQTEGFLQNTNFTELGLMPLYE